MEQQPLNLIEETISHLNEGARSVRAYTEENTLIITKATGTADSFWITQEEPGFPKRQTNSLEDHFQGVFGIEARY
jgi:hypothetical protein